MRVVSKRKWSKTWTPAAIMRLRRKLGLTQEQFAHAVNSTTSNVNRWERGGHCPHPLYLAMFDRLANGTPAPPEPSTGHDPQLVETVLNIVKADAIRTERAALAARLRALTTKKYPTTAGGSVERLGGTYWTDLVPGSVLRALADELEAEHASISAKLLSGAEADSVPGR